MSTRPAPPRRVEYLPISDLTEDPRNPKAHDLDVLDASVGRFGFVEPIIRDARTGYLISGHGRTKTLRAMEQRGEAPPEGILTDDDGRWLAPVVVGWASRSDSEASAALIALNRSTELGGWVDEELLDLLDSLSEEGDDGLDGVGFDEAQTEALRRRIEAQAYMDSLAIPRALKDDAQRDDDADAEFLDNTPLATGFGGPLNHHTLKIVTATEADTRALFAALHIPFEQDSPRRMVGYTAAEGVGDIPKAPQPDYHYVGTQAPLNFGEDEDGNLITEIEDDR